MQQEPPKLNPGCRVREKDRIQSRYRARYKEKPEFKVGGRMSKRPTCNRPVTSGARIVRVERTWFIMPRSTVFANSEANRQQQEATQRNSRVSSLGLEMIS